MGVKLFVSKEPNQCRIITNYQDTHANDYAVA